jgi:coiled-coil domain-containing protein 12
MSGTQGSLDAAAAERKARLAKLASLKRKQPGSDTTITVAPTDEARAPKPSETDVYISGRNYDITAKAPKLGFESAPAEDVETLEKRAERLAAEAKERAVKDEAENEKGIDLFKLQPKKPNWDLKRELAEKMKVVDVRTQNAIARLVRERIENSKKEAQRTAGAKGPGDGGEEVGMEGTTLAEAVREREREDEAERQQEDAEEEVDALP